MTSFSALEETVWRTLRDLNYYRGSGNPGSVTPYYLSLTLNIHELRATAILEKLRREGHARRRKGRYYYKRKPAG